MKTLVVWLQRPWPLLACALLYVGFVGPALISARSTLAVLLGLLLLVLLVAWGIVLLRRAFFHKG